MSKLSEEIEEKKKILIEQEKKRQADFTSESRKQVNKVVEILKWWLGEDFKDYSISYEKYVIWNGVQFTYDSDTQISATAYLPATPDSNKKWCLQNRNDLIFLLAEKKKAEDAVEAYNANKKALREQQDKEWEEQYKKDHPFAYKLNKYFYADTPQGKAIRISFMVLVTLLFSGVFCWVNSLLNRIIALK